MACGKATYGSRYEAVQAAYRVERRNKTSRGKSKRTGVKGARVAVYFCRPCGGYHYGRAIQE